jgi:putative resolvase
MDKYYRISEAARLLGVCSKTLRCWDSEGKITCRRTLGGHRRISILEIERLSSPLNPSSPSRSEGAIAIYCRVSSHEQKTKGDLDRQISVAQDYCAQHHLTPAYTFSDVGSGLNTRAPHATGGQLAGCDVRGAR